MTDAGLKHLKGLKNLQSLNLSHPEQTEVTDVGLQYLQGLENLQSLILNDNEKITDAGLEHLKGLSETPEAGNNLCRRD